MDISREHIFAILRSSSRFLISIKIISNAVAIVAIAFGQNFYNSQNDLVSGVAAGFFWFGVSVIIVLNVFLAFFEKNHLNSVIALHITESNLQNAKLDIDYLKTRESKLLAWQNINQFISAVNSEVLSLESIDDDSIYNCLNSSIELIFSNKLTLFGIADEYCNVALYIQDRDDGLLKCEACCRSIPSDALGEHRSWVSGEGHVGRAFQLRRELICADANSPDVRHWIAASPERFDDLDEERYVSLAAVPVALTEDHPLGVLIVTSAVAGRFRHADDNAGSDESFEERRIPIAALQDIAVQLAHLVTICESKRTPELSESSNGE